MTLALFGGHEHHVAHELRSRPYHGHVALEDVEEFGELVEAGAAQEPAVGGQAHVVGEQFPAGVALVGHGAELDELEYLFALPGSGLREEGVPAHLDGPNQRKENEQRAQAAQGRKRAAEVQDSFQAAWVHDTNIGYSETRDEQSTAKMSKNLQVLPGEAIPDSLDDGVLLFRGHLVVAREAQPAREDIGTHVGAAALDVGVGAGAAVALRGHEGVAHVHGLHVHGFPNGTSLGVHGGDFLENLGGAALAGLVDV